MSTTVQSVNPMTGLIEHEVPETSARELDALLEAAVAASHDLRLKSHSRRAGLLTEISNRLDRRRGEIIATAAGETALPTVRLEGELERTCFQLEMFAQVIQDGEHLDAMIDPADPNARPAPRPDLRRMMVPLGPVAVFGASNFPLAFSTAGGDTASALAAGCPVIVKGHSAHPLTGALVASEISAAVQAQELPAGTFAHVLTNGFELGTSLVADDRVEAVGFTGSTSGGLALVSVAAGRSRPIPVFAEMGSVNPVVITRGAAEARGAQIAEGLAASVATFGGQLCTKPGLVFVQESEATTSMMQATARALAGHGAETLLTRSICESYRSDTDDIAGLEGIRQLEPVQAAVDVGFDVAPVAFEAPIELLTSHPALSEEHFGPAVIFLTFNDLFELHPALLELGGQLTLTLHAEPAEYDSVQWLVALATKLAGRVLFDGYPTGVSVCWAMQHGGPAPATSDSRHTSVGATAIRRFLRPVVYQNCPPRLLPRELLDGNPMRIPVRVNGKPLPLSEPRPLR